MLVLLLLTTIINFFDHRTNIQKAREVKFSQRPYLNLRRAINLGLRTCLTYMVLTFFRWGHCLLIFMPFLARFLWEPMENNFYKVVKLYLNGRDYKSRHIYPCFTSWPNQHSTDLSATFHQYLLSLSLWTLLESTSILTLIGLILLSHPFLATAHMPISHNPI